MPQKSKIKYEHVRFIELYPGGWHCQEKETEEKLGSIVWPIEKHQYYFFPSDNIMLDVKLLKDIQEFLASKYTG